MALRLRMKGVRVRVRTRLVLVAMVVNLLSPVLGLGLRVSVGLCGLDLTHLGLLLAGDLLGVCSSRRVVRTRDRRVQADLYPG